MESIFNYVRGRDGESESDSYFDEEEFELEEFSGSEDSGSEYSIGLSDTNTIKLFHKQESSNSSSISPKKDKLINKNIENNSIPVGGASSCKQLTHISFFNIEYKKHESNPSSTNPIESKPSIYSNNSVPNHDKT
jgi:hypothetical protein